MIRRAIATILPAAPASEDSRPGRYPLMDGMRALAALSIFAYHAVLSQAPRATVSDFIEALNVGVPVFFVISGFLLYRPFALAALEGRAGPRPAAFAWRRALRVVPAFWLALGLSVGLGAERESWETLPYLFAFAQVYDPALLQLGLGQAWSLNCEVVYYAMLPLLAVAVHGATAESASSRTRLRLQIIAVAGLFALSEAYKLWFHSFGDLTSPRDVSFLFHPVWNLDVFAVGMAVALWSAHRQLKGGDDDRFGRFVAARPGVLWAAAGVAYAASVVAAGGYLEPWGNAGYHASRAVFALLILLPAMHGPVGAGRIRRFVGARWTLALGTLSYGIYLFHTMWLAQLDRISLEALPSPVRDSGVVVLALAGTVLTAAISWVLLERPVLALRRWVPDRPGRPREPLGTARDPLTAGGGT